MSIKAREHRLIQVISFIILNDSKFENKFSKEGRRWTKAMQTIQQQAGWLRTLYGRDLHSAHRIDLYIAWTDLGAAEAFTATSSFEATLAGIAVSSLATHYVEVQGSMPSHGPVEIVTLSFPSTLSHEDITLFDDQLDHCKHSTLPIVHGWIILRNREDDDVPQKCAVMFNWKSLDHMYDVKNNQNSFFNNGFLPLRDEAPEDSKTVLYTKLQDPFTNQSQCVIM